LDTVAIDTPADAAIVARVVRPACRPPVDTSDPVRGPPSAWVRDVGTVSAGPLSGEAHFSKVFGVYQADIGP
jgi:hypothetical protein